MMNENDLARRALTTLKVIPPTPDEITEQERRTVYEILLSFREDMGSYVKVWERHQIPTFEKSAAGVHGQHSADFAKKELAHYYHDIKAYHLTDQLTPDNAFEIFKTLCELADESDAKGEHTMVGSFLTLATNRVMMPIVEQKRKNQ